MDASLAGINVATEIAFKIDVELAGFFVLTFKQGVFLDLSRGIFFFKFCSIELFQITEVDFEGLPKEGVVFKNLFGVGDFQIVVGLDFLFPLEVVVPI